MSWQFLSFALVPGSTMFGSDTAAKEEDAPPPPLLALFSSPGTTPAHYNRGLSFERVRDGTDGLNFVPHIPSSPCALGLFVMKMSAKSEPPPPRAKEALPSASPCPTMRSMPPHPLQPLSVLYSFLLARCPGPDSALLPSLLYVNNLRWGDGVLTSTWDISAGL